MKKPGIILAVTLFVFSGSNVAAQESVTDIKLDKSPLDISYHRDADKQPLAKVQYSRPSKNGRTIFGELEPFGKVWRTGANESSEIRFFTDVSFGGKDIPAGTYSLFTIPDEENWTVILNSATDQWGGYSYDESKDVARVEVPAQRTAGTVELLTIYFDGENPAKSDLVIAWDNTVVKVPVEFNQ
ncbi:DUF2911 family protein [Anseongella ginsenosidimutans]|uniref:DUF2911 family protein n=1 Tax=Anseongella ginsenosidimutans TaxID=496056 RepID=A0A4R3KUS9_9SPHI|nr:DUF2911 domain-containing protein [Anseongella ginsenosidimutans]QEC51816.1 DUF2911 domain-containing protein [Anseongella ginsenosidimutans]TCS89187.1 DUF2911 family protein [Anseongella ginsenosidimutans]